jgi:hypothetical protein
MYNHGFTTKIKKKRQRPEEELCASFVKLWNLWAATYKLRAVLLHIPNGQRAGVSVLSRTIAGAVDKKLGARAGAPDYVIVWEGKAYFLEAKSAKGRQSESQATMEEDILRAGGKYSIFKSLEEAEYILTVWGILKNEI